jgi:UDPglucose 6-dehydrogenase
VASVKKIGIVGQGFVGSAVREGMNSSFTVETYDKYKGHPHSTKNSLKDLVVDTDVIFVCLPTPMRKDRSCDTRIVEDVVKEIDEIAKSCNDCKIVVVKSTIPPGTTERMNSYVKNCQVVFNPEFLTEANSFEDFKNQTRIVVGGPRPGSTIVKNIFRKAFPRTPIIKTGSNTAEMVKYFTNCFLSTKVSFANEMSQICEKIGIDYDKVVEYTLLDTRLGRSHWSVPGPDGSMGFGGHCFPKDLNALIHVAKDLDVKPTVMESVWEKNNEVRDSESRDWEHMTGRAVSED